MRWQAVYSGIGGRVETLLVWALSVLGTLSPVPYAIAFDKTCGALSTHHTSAVEALPTVVAIHTSGQATGMYRAVHQGTRQWRLEEGNFTLGGRGFVVGQLVVTAAHVVYPSKVEVRLDPYITTTTEVVSIQQTSVAVGDLQGTSRVPAAIVHLNHRLDLAILRPQSPLQEIFPYPTAVTWWSEGTGEAISLLNTGDCIVALVAARDASFTPLPQDEARQGNVLAPHAVSHQHSVVAGLSANTVSISTPVFPGDSGSPVVAFDAGKPRLVGVITATRQPFEAVSYISRLDPLLPILEALQASVALPRQVAKVN
jgi:S1-C subfamily serine protease